MPPTPLVKPSERLYEANFYSQAAYHWHPSRLAWFTPSQNQEKELAFDTYTKFGGRFFFFQFKWPKAVRVRKALCKYQHSYIQTHAEHEQLTTLRALAEGWPRNTFFYAMPALIDFPKATAYTNFLQLTHVLDVLNVPLTLPAPTTPRGQPRLSGYHYLNLDYKCAVWQLRSEPIDFEGTRFTNIVNRSLESWIAHDDDYFLSPSYREEHGNDVSYPARPEMSASYFEELTSVLPTGTSGLLLHNTPDTDEQ